MSINAIPAGLTNPAYRAPAKAVGQDKAYTQATEEARAATGTEKAGSSSSLDAFKQDIYAQLDKMKGCASTGVSIQISDAAFERMQSDPQFKAEMMDIIRRDLAGCQPPITSLMINITEKGYSGQSYLFGYEPGKLEEHEEKSFYKRPATTKHKYNAADQPNKKDEYAQWLEEQQLHQSALRQQAMKAHQRRKENSKLADGANASIQAGVGKKGVLGME